MKHQANQITEKLGDSLKALSIKEKEKWQGLLELLITNGDYKTEYMISKNWVGLKDFQIFGC